MKGRCVVDKIKDVPSAVQKFRDGFLKKGVELVDITPHLKFGLGISGWANSFNEPDQQVYHVQAFYRNEVVAVLGPDGYVVDEDLYVLFVDDEDFIVFRKVF